jgi:hypothetical protein
MSEDNQVREKKPPYLMFAIVIGFGLWGVGKYLLSIDNNLSALSKERESLIELKLEVKSYKDEVVKFKEYAYFSLKNDNLYSKNYTAFNVDSESKVCSSCHLLPNMYLLKSRLSITQFKDYVRGTKRHIDNHEMPKFDEAIVGDRTLEKMYLILKQDMDF